MTTGPTKNDIRDFLQKGFSELRAHVRGNEENFLVHARNPKILKAFAGEKDIGKFSASLAAYIAEAVADGGVDAVDAGEISRRVQRFTGMWCIGIEPLPEGKRQQFEGLFDRFLLGLPAAWAYGNPEALRTCGRGV